MAKLISLSSGNAVVFGVSNQNFSILNGSSYSNFTVQKNSLTRNCYLCHIDLSGIRNLTSLTATVISSLAGQSGNVSVSIYEGVGPSYRLRRTFNLGTFTNSQLGDKISQTFITNYIIHNNVLIVFTIDNAFTALLDCNLITQLL
jgi:hypothetical protein